MKGAKYFSMYDAICFAMESYYFIHHYPTHPPILHSCKP